MNLHKKMYLGVIAMLSFLLSACGSNENKLMKITDFEQYQELQKKPISVTVEYDDAYVGIYEIADEELISQLMEILLEKTYFEKGEDLAAGGNSKLILKYKDGSEVSISLYRIKDNNQCYYYATSELLDFVYKIGIDNNELTEK